MTVKSIKHSKEKRVLIPSREEAGQEAASPKVKAGKDKAEFPVNPVVHRGQDPELFWMRKYGADDRADRLNVDIRSLYRHEHIAPEKVMKRLYRLTEVPKQQVDDHDLADDNLKAESRNSRWAVSNCNYGKWASSGSKSKSGSASNSH